MSWCFGKRALFVLEELIFILIRITAKAMEVARLGEAASCLLVSGISVRPFVKNFIFGLGPVIGR